MGSEKRFDTRGVIRAQTAAWQDEENSHVVGRGQGTWTGEITIRQERKKKKIDTKSIHVECNNKKWKQCTSQAGTPLGIYPSLVGSVHEQKTDAGGEASDMVWKKREGRKGKTDWTLHGSRLESEGKRCRKKKGQCP